MGRRLRCGARRLGDRQHRVRRRQRGRLNHRGAGVVWRNDGRLRHRSPGQDRIGDSGGDATWRLPDVPMGRSWATMAEVIAAEKSRTA